MEAARPVLQQGAGYSKRLPIRAVSPDGAGTGVGPKAGLWRSGLDQDHYVIVIKTICYSKYGNNIPPP